MVGIATTGQAEASGQRLRGIQQRAAAYANYHRPIVAGRAGQLADIAFATVAFKEDFFGLRER
ncbi:Uncharacterised protein [Klebsiella oxytoca]|nr:Uncharacterised protein [Klebsiella oxytoca]